MRPIDVQATPEGELLFRGTEARPIAPLTFERADGSLLVFREDAGAQITELLVDQDVYERVTADQIQAYEEASRPEFVSLDRDVLKRYAGRYDGPEGIVTIRAGQEGLEVEIPGRGVMTFRPSDERTFFLEDYPVRLEFLTRGGSEVRGAMIVVGDEVIELVKMNEQ